NQIASRPTSLAASGRPGWAPLVRVAAAVALATLAGWLAHSAIMRARSHAPMLPQPDESAVVTASTTPSANAIEPVQVALVDDDRLKVSIPTQNPRIHIVWLYDTPRVKSAAT